MVVETNSTWGVVVPAVPLYAIIVMVLQASPYNASVAWDCFLLGSTGKLGTDLKPE